MRALTATVLLLLLVAAAGSARADDLHQRGRRKQRAAIALFVIGSVAIVASGPFLALATGYNCPRTTVPACGTNQLIYWGIAFLAGGAAAHGVAMPLYLSGSSDVDRDRSGPTSPLAAVRF